MPRIGVLASHEGSTLQSIIDACAQERINGRVVAVISNNSGPLGTCDGEAPRLRYPFGLRKHLVKSGLVMNS